MSEKGKRNSKKSVVFVWLISYVSILLIPIIISSLIYYEAERIVVNEINRTNSALLRQLQQLMDGRLEDIQRLSQQIALNSKTRSIMYIKDELQPYQHYTVAKLSDDFKFYKIANSFINRFYVYFKNTDYVLTDQTFARSRMIFDMNVRGGNITYEQWIDLLRKPDARGYTLLPNSYQDGTVKKSIAFLQSLPIEEQNNSEATLVILLEEDQVQENIRSLEWTNQGRVIIMDADDSVLASTQSLAGFKLPSYRDLEGETGIFYNIEGNETDVVSYTSSAISSLKYLSIIPKRTYGKKVEDIRRLSAVGLLLCFAAGGLAAYVFTKKNYSPVNQLVQAVMKNIGGPSKKVGNEYNYLDEAISLTLNEKEIIKQKLNQQKSIMRSNLLMRLYKGKFCSSVPLKDLLASAEIQFFSERFAVILFFLEDYSKFLPPEELESSEDNLNLMQFVIINIVEELAAQNHHGLVTEVDGMMTCLINFRDGPDPGEEKQELMRIAVESHRIINETFQIYFSVSISNIESGIAGISTAYDQAVEALEYRLIRGREQILCYDEIKSRENTVFYQYDLTEEQQLINSIKTGDYKKSEQIVNRIMTSLFTKEFVPIQTAKCLIFDIVSTLLKALGDMDLKGNNNFIGALNPVDKLLACETVEDMKNQMMNILKDVCLYIEQKKGSHNHNMKNDILNYIEEHYSDEDFSISAMAEQLQLNYNYLSRFFKEQTGEGLLEYTNRYRLEKAKQLLKTSDKNISDIARNVGFYNSNAFIRVFKKYEGITPGQYKGM